MLGLVQQTQFYLALPFSLPVPVSPGTHQSVVVVRSGRQMVGDGELQCVRVSVQMGTAISNANLYKSPSLLISGLHRALMAVSALVNFESTVDTGGNK